MWWHTVLASAPPGGGDAHGAAPLEVHLPARDAAQAVVAGDAGSAVYGRRLAGRAGADALQAATGGAEAGWRLVSCSRSQPAGPMPHAWCMHTPASTQALSSCCDRTHPLGGGVQSDLELRHGLPVLRPRVAGGAHLADAVGAPVVARGGLAGGPGHVLGVPRVSAVEDCVANGEVLAA
jgi:hypothetical protein